MTEREKQRRARQRQRDQERRGSMTVDEWAEHRRVSRSMVYKLWEQGRGPKWHYVGAKRLISAEADTAWVREREAEAARNAAEAA